VKTNYLNTCTKPLQGHGTTDEVADPQKCVKPRAFNFRSSIGF